MKIIENLRDMVKAYEDGELLFKESDMPFVKELYSEIIKICINAATFGNKFVVITYRDIIPYHKTPIGRKNKVLDKVNELLKNERLSVNNREYQSCVINWKYFMLQNTFAYNYLYYSK